MGLCGLQAGWNLPNYKHIRWTNYVFNAMSTPRGQNFMKPPIQNTIETPYICYQSHCDRPITKDTLQANRSMLSAYISVPQGRILVKNHRLCFSISPLSSFTQNSAATYTLFTHSTDSSLRPFFHILYQNASLFNPLPANVENVVSSE